MDDRGKRHEWQRQLLGKSLTPRECEIVRLIGKGCANKEIAARLGLAPLTVPVYNTRLYRKLGLGNRVQVALWAANLSASVVGIGAADNLNEQPADQQSHLPGNVANF